MNSQNCEPVLTPETPTQRLASIVLGQPVTDFIATRRAAGVAWRLIERELREATDGQIDVTYETLRQWHEGAAA